MPAPWSTAVVGPDIHIKVGRTLYSALWKLIGRWVDGRSTATLEQVFLDGELVKTHAALASNRIAAGSGCPLPAPHRPGRPRPTQEVRRPTPGCRLRKSGHGR
ncbi:Mu transposase domain-containing protein [Streptomyces shenzhenensis]